MLTQLMMNLVNIIPKNQHVKIVIVSRLVLAFSWKLHCAYVWPHRVADITLFHRPDNATNTVQTVHPPLCFPSLPLTTAWLTAPWLYCYFICPPVKAGWVLSSLSGCHMLYLKTETQKMRLASTVLCPFVWGTVPNNVTINRKWKCKNGNVTVSLNL